LTSRLRICASRFCSTTNTCSCAAMNCATLSRKREGAQPQRVEVDALRLQRLQRLVHRGLVEPK
jgi:hypothetical protein